MSWSTNIADISTDLSPIVIDWMLKPYNLSEALSRVCTHLSVQILFQGIDHYRDDEARVLRVEDEINCYVRQVFLRGDGVPLCFARIVASMQTYYQYEAQFSELNDQFLGNVLLYHNPMTRRDAFEYAQLSSSHPYRQYLENRHPLGARRSVFYMDGQFPLLVSEIFLESIPEYKAVKLGNYV